MNGEEGGGAAIAMFRHELSEVSSVEVVASTGLHALIGVQTTWWVILYFVNQTEHTLLPVLAILLMFLVLHIPAMYHHTQLQQWA